MAKLFEDVLNGSARQADILIHFAGSCCADGPPSALSPAPAGSALSATSPGGVGAAAGCSSPRAVPAAIARTSCSPSSHHLGAPAGAEAPSGPLPTFIACHSLILRTQPCLLERLLLPAHGRCGGDLEARPGVHMQAEGADAEGCPMGYHSAAALLHSGSEGPVEAIGKPASESSGDVRMEVTVTDEAEVFLEMIKFVYLNQCHVDQNNVKGLMHVADKYGVEDMVGYCLQWMHEHFTANLFYHFLTFKLSSERFAQKLRRGLLSALRSRRHFSLVTECADNQFEKLQVCFVEALLDSDELPVVSEAEVIQLIAKWAGGAFQRQEEAARSHARVAPANGAPAGCGSPQSAQASPHRQEESQHSQQPDPSLSASEDAASFDAGKVHSGGESSDQDADCGRSSRACGGGAGASAGANSAAAATSPAARCSLGPTIGAHATAARAAPSGAGARERNPRGSGGGEAGAEDGVPHGAKACSREGSPERGRRIPSDEGSIRSANSERYLCRGSGHGQAREDLLRLLRTFRIGDTVVRIGDIEPILRVLNLNSLFSTKQPRENLALDPGFMIYRGVAGVNIPATFGDLNKPNVVPAVWKGGSVTLGGHDFLQQQDGFRPSSVPEGSYTVFPRLWVQIKCSSWQHSEKRTSKSSAAGRLSRHGSLGPITDVGPGAAAWDTAGLMSMPPVNEDVRPEKGPSTLKMSQDDWEIGRRGSATRSVVPGFSDNAEKIDHKVVLAVISGHMRHGIRIGQHERSSIYNIEELHGQGEEVCLGGSPTDVEFELQLTVHAPSKCGICSCALAVLPPGEQECPPDPLLKVDFDASAEEHLHFYISSSHFDSNSTYGVALNWVLRPGTACSPVPSTTGHHC